MVKGNVKVKSKLLIVFSIICAVLLVKCEPGNIKLKEVDSNGGYCINIEEEKTEEVVNFECSDISCTDVECVLDNFGVEN
jgi:hypothetical protein